MGDKFHLKWNDFQSTVSNSFKVFREQKDFFDVTLVSDDEVQMASHKLILSACSSFFQSILKNNPHPNPLIYLHGIDSLNLGYILDYIYNGEVQLHQEHLDPFMDKAQVLKISGLITSDKEEETVPFPYVEHEPFEAKNYASTDNSFDVEKIEVGDFGITTTKSRYTRSSELIKSVAVTADGRDLSETINEMFDKENEFYVCKSCGKTAKRREHIIKHIEIHIEGLSYDCPLCDKTFRSRNSLQFHKSKYHYSNTENQSSFLFQE